MNKKTSGKRKPPKRVVNAPMPTGQMAIAPAGIHNVFLTDNEEVEWSWTHTPAGSFVSGYRVVKNS
jgi:hypothetical protein